MTTLRELIREKGCTNKQIADALGIDETNIRRFDDLSKRKLSELIIISNALNITLDELINYALKSNEVLSDSEVNYIYSPKYTEKMQPEGSIKLYDLEASANLHTLFLRRDENILGEINVPNVPVCDGAVYVKGDSMYPLLKSGDIIAYKIIKPEVQNIFFGEMYLLSIDMDGDEYLTVKYVNRSDRGEEWIRLDSFNKYYEPKDFPLSSVRAMALVKLSISVHTMK